MTQLRDAARAARDFLDEELGWLLKVQADERRGEPVEDLVDELVPRYLKLIGDLNAALRATSAVVVALRQIHPAVVAENNARQGAQDEPGLAVQPRGDWCDFCRGPCRCAPAGRGRAS